MWFVCAPLSHLNGHIAQKKIKISPQYSELIEQLYGTEYVMSKFTGGNFH